MIRRAIIKNYRMLRANDVALPPFVVLVGKNATGKSTFLGALRFVSDLLRGGVDQALEGALEHEAPNFLELCFDPRLPIEIAVEVDVDGRPARYEVQVGPDPSAGIAVLREQLYLLPEPGLGEHRERAWQQSLWGADEVTALHVSAPRGAGWRKVAGKTDAGGDYFHDEKTNWNTQFRFGAQRAALGAIPEDPSRFPVALQVRDLLRDGVTMMELDSRRLREPSAPRAPTRLLPDGSNLARAAAALKASDAVAFDQWVSHVGSAIEGLTGLDVWERPEDKKLVLRARFAGVHADPVPSWLLSDGTLRLLALSILSYAGADTPGIALVEEPENGLHPLAMQAVYDALSQPHERGQVLVATHSPVFLAQARLADALVFRRAEDGAAIVRRGDEVPELRDWKQTASLADVFATGVLA